MKLLLFTVEVLIVFGLSSSEYSCDTWPSELIPVKECCNLPKRYICAPEISCEKECSEENSSIVIDSTSNSDGDLSKMKTCIESCFIKLSDLVSEDKSINKTAAKKLYHNDDPNGPSWKSEVDEAVEKCDFGSADSLSSSLVQFFNCIEDELKKNCVDFMLTIECQQTAIHFEKCTKSSENCAIGFELKHCRMAMCCELPKIFTDGLITKCYEKCESTVYFRRALTKCILNCLNEETKFENDKGFDFEVIKTLLVDNSNKSVDWSEIIDNTVKSCETSLTKLSEKTNIREFNYLVACLYEKMSLQCPSYQNNSFCQEFVRYKNGCPGNFNQKFNS